MSHGGHSHAGHSHEGGTADDLTRRGRIALFALVGALLLATIAGILLLLPGAERSVERTAFLAPGVEIVPVTVTVVDLDGRPTEQVAIEGEARSGDLEGRTVQVEVPPEVAADGIQVGDRIRALSVAVPTDAGADGSDWTDEEGALEADGTTSDETASDETSADGFSVDPSAPLYYFDHDRGLPLGLLAIAYLLLVALVARGRGLRAMVGLAAGVAIVLWFMLPAILAGESPILVALVSAAAMIFPSVYLAHGVSVRTSTAVLGTVAGIAVTVLVALLWAGPSGMTGSQGDAPLMLYGAHPEMSLGAVFLAGVIISGLGALNDVTITQASSVWELRRAMPGASRLRVFTSAMRIGSDHIASTVYTLAYAYIGSALPLLMYASTLDRSILDSLISGEIAEEVFRTLVASMGLVLAIPLTTAIAAALASPHAAAAGAPSAGPMGAPAGAAGAGATGAAGAGATGAPTHGAWIGPTGVPSGGTAGSSSGEKPGASSAESTSADGAAGTGAGAVAEGDAGSDGAAGAEEPRPVRHSTRRERRAQRQAEIIERLSRY
ncbi:YibE/F family protein [Brachybacterium sp. DNPG3]